jgi:hypothetical protein
MKKLILSLAAITLLSGVFLSSAHAVTTNKVDICHATASNTNPYITNQPDKSGDVAGHDGHNGPIWFSGITVAWGDIIPPFDYQSNDVIGTHLDCTGGGYTLNGNVCTKNNKPDMQPVVVNDYGLVTHHYAGKNYDAQGQAILNNNCVYVAPVVVTPTIVPVTPTATPTAAVTPTPTNTPSNGGNGGGAGDGLGCATHDCSGNQVGGPSTSGAVLGTSTGPIQAVLGASTMAGTGTFENSVMTLMLLAGMIVLSLGGLSYAKENK